MVSILTEKSKFFLLKVNFHMEKAAAALESTVIPLVQILTEKTDISIKLQSSR